VGRGKWEGGSEQLASFWERSSYAPCSSWPCVRRRQVCSQARGLPGVTLRPRGASRRGGTRASRRTRLPPRTPRVASIGIPLAIDRSVQIGSWIGPNLRPSVVGSQLPALLGCEAPFDRMRGRPGQTDVFARSSRAAASDAGDAGGVPRGFAAEIATVLSACCTFSLTYPL